MDIFIAENCNDSGQVDSARSRKFNIPVRQILVLVWYEFTMHLAHTQIRTMNKKSFSTTANTPPKAMLDSNVMTGSEK